VALSEKWCLKFLCAVAAFVEVFIFGGGRIDEPESERKST